MNLKYMTFKHSVLILFCISVLFLSNSAQLYAFNSNQVTAKNRKSIVKILTRSTEGTGFIVTKAGLILTCLHLVKDTDHIQVILENGKSYTANMVRPYPEIDISVIKINGIENPNTVVFGDSTNLKEGEWVLAGGYLQNSELTFTAGIVITKGPNFIQTDTATPISFDGSPLFDRNGEVIGVIAAGVQSKNEIRHGIAVPMNLIKSVLIDISKMDEREIELPTKPLHLP